MDQQAQEIEKQTVIEDEKPRITLADKLRDQKKKQRKQTIKRTIFISIGLLVSYSVWFLFKPFQASAEYGICRTFLELTVPYPHSIYVSEVKNKRNDPGVIQLWYTHTDAFGEFRMEDFTCRMAPNPKTGALEVTEIKMRKVNMEQQRVAHLNSALPYFAEQPLILNYPTALPDSIDALQLDFDAHRRIKIDIKK